MTEDLDLSALGADEEEPQTFPVPGGRVDLIPVPATIITERGQAKVKPGGSWGYCPFGVFVTEAEETINESTIKFDGLIPYKQITGIIFHYEEFQEWQKGLEADANDSD